jgi:hypothetical protein
MYAIMSRKMGDRPGASGVAPAAVAAPAVAPVAAPAPAAGPSSAELAALLSSLADLRDKGAITTEEFEAKKADILARM